MKDFTFHTPTEIVFGRDAQRETANLIKKHGGGRVLVVYGAGSAVKSGLLGQIIERFKENGIVFLAHGGVKPNPVLSHVREGIEKASEFGADLILAIGGGSAIDAAKAIAHGAANPKTDVWEFWERRAELTRSLPVGAVLTIPAAGSETSDSAVLTNDKTGKKRGLGSPYNVPRFAVMNPALAATLPKYQIACGVVDIMMHTMDRYFTKADGNETTDALAAALLRTVIQNGPRALKKPSDYDAMSELMWCGSLSHNGLTGLGRARDFSVHQLGHELSGMFDVAHGASLSAMWGSWARYCYQTSPARFAQFAESVWDVPRKKPDAAAITGIDHTVQFFASLGMPTNLHQLGLAPLSDAVLGELADSCVFYGKRLIGDFRPLDRGDVLRIYQIANGQ
jgi:alcohol dehydrogenase YqhD (iron-dependent ADH family)